ncbi:hypothetical protein [Bradyrhizobium sp. WSM3983]|uniref:hypothetical protein n=1 Tax=Bradyrhizobium sp. WSM3983 TaxID=1038867 RepID=UPI0004004F77
MDALVDSPGDQASGHDGRRTSIADRSIIHGPCTIGDDVFVGFNSVVFNCTIGDGSR